MAQQQMTRDQAVAIAIRSRGRDKKQRQRNRELENALVRKAAVSLTAGAYGALKRYAISDEVGGVPWKLPIWAGATLIEVLSENPLVTAFFAGISDATEAVYVTNALGTKNWVAGVGDVGALVNVSGGELE
jgi:hypothetical protein